MCGSSNDGFPVAGVGASAGGLESFTELLRNIPADSGIAWVFVQHLDPHHASLLSEILARETTMPVSAASDGMFVEKDHVYLIPPNTSLTIDNGQLKLELRADSDVPFMPIDRFLRSLAHDCGSRGLAIILSGGGTDGTLGLVEIKGKGGITFVQEGNTAKFDMMPRSAEGSGCADFVLPPVAIAQEIIRLNSFGIFSRQAERQQIVRDETIVLPKLFKLLGQRTGVDFSDYKPPTIRRRIARRMALNGFEHLADYVASLPDRPEEQQALHDDILIGVTRFFRDPATFELLQSTIFPRIIQNRLPNSPIRIWVAGCSTGEEVYSIAIVLMEVLGDLASATPVKILATDINEAVLEKARSGAYIDNIVADVSQDRLRRFFSKVNSQYQISKSIREMCVFSRHNLATDTPFASLDLISCRNLLIYFDSRLQKRVIPFFHYALKPKGYLILGNSESLGSFADYFTVIDKETSIFSRKLGSPKLALDFPVFDSRFASKTEIDPAAPSETFGKSSLQLEIDAALGNHSDQTAIIVDETNTVLQFHGKIAGYLNPTPGTASFDLWRLFGEGLGIEIHAAVDAARRGDNSAQRDVIQFLNNGGSRTVHLDVRPVALTGIASPVYVVKFDELPDSTVVIAEPSILAASSSEDLGLIQSRSRIDQLQRQLTMTHSYLQSITQEKQSASEELKAANEEILSSNEELQSTNEELQTAKEELQSTNEELSTVNEELGHRNRELKQLNNDLINLFAGLDIPIIIISRDLRIRRFTPPAANFFNLIATDVGRPISDLHHNIDQPNLPKLIAGVIDSVRATECEVKTTNGHWFSLRIRPYITTDNMIDGAALMLVDIDASKRGVAELKAARDNAEAIVEAVVAPLVVLDQDLRVQRANAAFHTAFQREASEAEGNLFFELDDKVWNCPKILEKLNRVIPENERIHDCEFEAEFPRLGHRTLMLNALRIVWDGQGTRMILMTIEDVTHRKKNLEQAKLLAREQAARAEAESQNRMKDEFLAMLAHELRNPLAPIRNSFYILQQRFADDPLVVQALQISNRQIGHMSRLLDDLLDIARIRQGKISLRIELVDFQTVISRAVENSRSFIKERDHHLDVLVPSNPVYLAADPDRLEQIFCNLLNNAVKYTDRGGKITIEAIIEQASIVIRITDDGIGISAELLPRVFDLFTQASRSIDRSQGGLGIGLTLVKNLVELHSGTVQVSSDGEGHGSTFTLSLPVLPSSLSSLESRNMNTSDRPTTKRRILIVDDNRDSADSLSILLRASHHETIVAYSASDALILVVSEHPDAIVLDIGLPEMSGFEVCSKIRQELKLTEILIIAVTGYGQEDDRRKAFDSGFSAFCVKPVDPDELLSMMDHQVPKI